MPYIKYEDRKEIRDNIHHISSNTAGELNYTISLLIHNYIEQNGLNYSSINTAIGVLECAKLELYRKVAAPYEDIKKEQNGGVSILDMEVSDV